METHVTIMKGRAVHGFSAASSSDSPGSDDWSTLMGSPSRNLRSAGITSPSRTGMMSPSFETVAGCNLHHLQQQLENASCATTPLVNVVVAVVACVLTWSATLLPFWLVQSGQRVRDGTTSSYAQGIGLWLNYTQHVGDASFDPGNSLWTPLQANQVATFADQCTVRHHAFCLSIIGELYRQYCEVMDVFCGEGLLLVQIVMAFACGLSLLILLASVAAMRCAHKTLADQSFTPLCLLNSLLLLSAIATWYYSVHNGLFDTAFYTDELRRCYNNPNSVKSRVCWKIGASAFMAVTAAVLNTCLAVLSVIHHSRKFDLFQEQLRLFYEQLDPFQIPNSLEFDQAAAAIVVDNVDLTLGITSDSKRVRIPDEESQL